uniref:Major facilitator superfamily (MFS) profile domain-containing protein n=1 Tax=Syphacia muris TaxID=451379 RepID=A0A0N5AN53_9BILA
MSSNVGTLIGNGIVGILTGITFGNFIDRSQLKLVLHRNPRDEYTIFQVEAIFISGLIGFGCGVPISYLQKHIKLYYVIVIGCFGATISLLLLWTLSDTYAWYSSTTISIFNFLAGYSVAHIYYTSLWVGFSASNSLNIVTLLHHLPLVSNALVLRLIVGNTHSYLFSVEFCATILATVAAIVLLRTSPTIEEPVRVVGEARRFTLPAYEYPASDTG